MKETVFGKRLKQLREELSLTQTDLARILKVSPSTIATYESRTDRIPEPEILLAIAKFFGVSTDYLLGLSDSRKGIPDPLEQDWPSAVKVLRRANRHMTEEEKEFIVSILEAYLKSSQERKRGK